MINKNYYPKIELSAFAVMALLLFILLYFIPRANFLFTYGIFTALFLLCFYIIKNEEIFSFQHCIYVAIILRLLAVFSLPALSDDYFRFIWDGKMMLLHINPFQYTPQEFLKAYNGNGYLLHLYTLMNSQEYHTIYPPVMQFIFFLSAFMGGSYDWLAVIIMKIFIVAAEIGSIKILCLLANKFGFNKRNLLWYILNPLIIVELTGNAHFEAIMIFFFLFFLYFLLEKKIAWSALFFALAVCTKLIPLMLAPLIIRYIGFKKSLLFGAISFACIILLFVPFINGELVNNISKSFRLFYHLFEFNASVFYFIRWLAYFFVTYDVIEQVAPVLGCITFISIVLISLWPSKRFSFIEKSLWIFSIYFLFSTMVHPWYCSILVALAVLSRFRFPVVFSFLILLSYYPYSLKIYNEDTGLWWIALEYCCLFIYVGYELFQLKKRKKTAGALF